MVVGSRFLVRDDVDELATLAVSKLHSTVDLGEQRIIAALADVFAGVELGSALANNDGTCRGKGSVEYLDAESLSVGITTVAG